MKVVIIRHAEPDYEHNTLTKKGFKEARLLAKVYKQSDFDDIYCSPLERAKLTCKAVCKDESKINYCDWLVEFGHPVEVNGTKRNNWDFYPTDLENQEGMFDYNRYLDTPIMVSGDMKKHVDEVYANLDNLMSKYGYMKKDKHFEVSNSSTKTIVFFCHLGIESVILSYFLNIPYVTLAQGFCPLPSSVTTIVSEERKKGEALFRVLTLGDLFHLKRKNEPASFFARFAEIFDSKDRH